MQIGTCMRICGYKFMVTFLSFFSKAYLLTRRTGTCILICLGLVFLGKIPFVASFWSNGMRNALEITQAIDSAFSPVAKPRVWFQTKDSLRKKLMDEELSIRRKDAQLVKLQSVLMENKDLRDSLASISGEKKMWVPAHFLVTQSSAYIDVGSADKIEVGSVVVSSGIYLGSVVQVQAHVAKISTVASDGSRIGVRTGPSDRKSTRLNSSHQIISYAVFCLKKKKKHAQ